MTPDKKINITVTAKDEASAKLQGIDKNVNSMATGFKVAGAAIAVDFARRAVTALFDVGKQALNLAGDLQATELAFKVLLGSAEEAEATMKRIREEAKRTPFEIQGLSDATLAITAITKDGDEALDIILDIGEAIAASGKGQPELDRVILNLQQIASTGKVTEMDMRQFASAIPGFYDVLEQSTGKSLQELKDNNELTFETISQAFKDATEEGGAFFGMYEESAGSYNQATSNMRDTWNIFISDLVTSTGLMDAVSEQMTGISDTDFTEISDGIKEVVVVIKNILMEALEGFKITLDSLGLGMEEVKTVAIAVFVIIGLAIGAVVGLVGGLIILILGIAKALNWVAKQIANGIIWIINAFNRAKSAVMNFSNAITSAISGAMATAKGIVIGAVNWIITKINSVIGKVNTVASKIPGFSGISEISHLAMGSDNFRGGSAVVGENGPELVNLPKGAQVLNTQASEGAMQSAFNNYGTINLNSAGAVNEFAKQFSVMQENFDNGFAS